MARPIEPTPIITKREDIEEFLRLTWKEERDPDPKRIAWLKEAEEYYIAHKPK